MDFLFSTKARGKEFNAIMKTDKAMAGDSSLMVLTNLLKYLFMNITYKLPPNDYFSDNYSLSIFCQNISFFFILGFLSENIIDSG